MNNPMQMLMSMIQGGGNPMQMMQMFTGNPMMSQAQRMVQGKNKQQIQELVFNIAKEKGIDEEQLREMAQKMGLKL